MRPFYSEFDAFDQRGGICLTPVKERLENQMRSTLSACKQLGPPKRPLIRQDLGLRFAEWDLERQVKRHLDEPWATNRVLNHAELAAWWALKRALPRQSRRPT